MNKNVKGIIAVAIVGVIGYVTYKKFVKPDSKKVVIAYLDSTFGKDAKHTDFVNGAGASYIDSWAKAIMSGSDTFTDSGNTYITNGGTVKK
jgi:hypothetical protein